MPPSSSSPPLSPFPSRVAAMQFTVDQIRSVRDSYREPPYPGFSLDEVCRRRRMAQTKLVRGENAWQATGSAQTTEEWVRRLVQGSLNKICDKSFDTLVTKMCTKELFATPEILKSVVSIIFQKVLDEPENSKLYAAVCRRLAQYEVSLLDPTPTTRPHSVLRHAIVTTAQAEFKNYRHTESDDTKELTEEEREHRRSNFMRRKRANIRFVGELYLQEVLSNTTIFDIMSIVTRANEKGGGFPESENIELLAELFQTIGEVLDRQHHEDVDRYFALLSKLIKRKGCPYPSRILFKIMDLLDLRENRWGTKTKASESGAARRPVATGPSSPASRKGKGDAKTRRDTAAPTKKDYGSNGANKGGGRATGGGGGGRQGAGMAATTAAASPPSTSLVSRAAEATLSSSTVPSAVTTVSARKVVKFELRVHSLWQEWVADCTNDFMPKWIDEFNDCDREFDSANELCVAVAVEVITSACTTTRTEAQREACSFLIVGLYLTDEEIFAGFARALATAVEDGLLEDVPRFPERFMGMLCLTSSEEEVNADVYYDAANLLCMAFNRMSEPDEYTVNTLLDFWAKVPRPDADCSEEDRVILNFAVVYSLCEQTEPKPGLEKLISAIIESLHSMSIVEEETIQEFLGYEADTNPLYGKIVMEYKMLTSAR